MRQADFNIRAWILVSLIASAVPCGRLSADEAIARADQLTAAYLINFTQFVQWPATADNTLTICFLGGEGVHEALARAIASKKKVAGGALAVRSLERGAPLDGCKVLFIASTHWAAADRGPRQSDAPVLTVSDASGFARDGGMIELFNEHNRLRFRINAGTAEAGGLQISSSLLQLAVSVEREPPQ